MIGLDILILSYVNIFNDDHAETDSDDPLLTNRIEPNGIS